MAFGVSSDAVRAAVTAVRRKDWKPSPTVEKACQRVPSNLVMLSVTDVSESLSSLLGELARHTSDYDQHVDRAGQASRPAARTRARMQQMLAGAILAGGRR